MSATIQRSLAEALDSEPQFTIHSTFSPANRVTLYHGNCLDFLATIPDESVQLVVTSPPYNLGKEYEEVVDLEQYKAQQQQQVIDACARILHPSGSICWEVGSYVHNGEIIPLDILLYDGFKEKGLRVRNRIVWHFGHWLHCQNRFAN